MPSWEYRYFVRKLYGAVGRDPADAFVPSRDHRPHLFCIASDQIH